MLTPQEVSGHAFAKASFGGYNMAMVDEFLDTLTEDYTTLYKENQVLKSKMKILVDKVEEYRATDDSMRKAFLVAQKSAEDIIAKAEAERATLVQRAEDEARAKIAGLRSELENEQHRLAAAQNATELYAAKLRELCQHELEYLGTLPGLTTPAPTHVEKAANEIESSMQKIVEETSAPVADEEPTMDLDKELEELRVRPDSEEPEEEDTDDEEPLPRSDSGLYAELLELNITPKGDIEHKPRRLMEELGLELDEDDESEPQAAREAPARGINFDNLQFGKDYEIR